MNVLRTVFMSTLITAVYCLTAYSLVELIRGMQPQAAWLGLLLAAGAPAFYFSWSRIRPAASTARRPLLVTVISGLGVAINMTISWRYGEAAGIVHVFSGAMFIGWVIYLRWYMNGQFTPT